MKATTPLIATFLLLTGCGQPLLDLPSTSFDTCIGHGLSAVVRGDAEDPDLAWLEDYETGERLNVVWPNGFSARFTPGLEVLDPSGQIVLQDGDFVDATCGRSSGRELLAPPFLALKLDCGPVRAWECQIMVRSVAVINGWPERDIAGIQFLDGGGGYRLDYEDGTTVSGPSTRP